MNLWKRENFKIGNEKLRRGFAFEQLISAMLAWIMSTEHIVTDSRH